MKLLAEYSNPEQSALRVEVCPEATDDQINYYLRVCHAKSVDPFSGLLYLQRRMTKGKYKCGVSPTIDGARASAARTGFYAGSDEPEYDSEEGDRPKWCRVSVYRMVKGERCAYTSKLRWAEFCPKPPNDFQWKDKPYHMLAKCAEMSSLRKAFPELVSGAGEDDYEDEVETAAPDTAKEEMAHLAVQWLNAVKAFLQFGKSEQDMLAKLSLIDKSRVSAENIETLKAWYDELQRDKNDPG